MNNGVFIERRLNGYWYIVEDCTGNTVLASKETIEEAQDWCSERDIDIVDIRY